MVVRCTGRVRRHHRRRGTGELDPGPWRCRGAVPAAAGKLRVMPHLRQLLTTTTLLVCRAGLHPGFDSNPSDHQPHHSDAVTGC